ncbi:MAG: hypothetical protein GY851_31155, partial [bacterium]|nr:hypothetical protein [bacterium]
MSKEPPKTKDGEYSTVYAAIQLDSGVWHCLVTEEQHKRFHATADTFDKLDKKHKQDDTPAHVFGNCVRAPGKRWGTMDKVATTIDAVEIRER